MRFSVCIPNFNYARYLGRTIESLRAQQGVDLEIMVSDNASTDESVEVVQALADPRIRVRTNHCNVGFARNLDRAAELATGEWMIMLSSDDLARAGALGTYARLIESMGPESEKMILTSTVDVIDPHDLCTGRFGPDAELWTEGDRDPDLSRLAGAPVYRVEAGLLLRRCLRSMKNPFNFAATAYARSVYETLHGYGGGRLINPDKWFHWRLLGVAREALFVDAPLFAYRWHPANQSAQQQKSGALKYLADDYATVLEVDATLFEKSNVTRAELERAFVERDVIRHGAATLARGDRRRARRIVRFGQATFPDLVRRSRGAFGLRLLLALGAVGEWVAKVALKRYAASDGHRRAS